MTSILAVPQMIAETINKVNIVSSFNNTNLYNDFINTKAFKFAYEVSSDPEEVKSHTYTVRYSDYPIKTITNISGIKIKTFICKEQELFYDYSVYGDIDKSPVIIQPFSQNGEYNLMVFGDNILKMLFLMLLDKSKLSRDEKTFVHDVYDSITDFYRGMYFPKNPNKYPNFIDYSIINSISPLWTRKCAFGIFSNALAFSTLYFTAFTGKFDYMTIEKNLKKYVEVYFDDAFIMECLTNLFNLVLYRDYDKDDFHIKLLECFDPLIDYCSKF